MTRITNALREKIIMNALTKCGYTAERTAHDEKRAAWYEVVRVETLGGEDEAKRLQKIQQDYEALQKTLPEELRGGSYAVEHNSSALMNLAGARVRLSFGDYRISYYRPTIGADNPLVQQFYDLEAEKKRLDDKGDTVTAQLQATLSKFQSVKKLLEAWPEAAELIPETMPESKMNLPALPVAELNKLVGLPSNSNGAK